jgi:hypothetical protein
MKAAVPAEPPVMESALCQAPRCEGWFTCPWQTAAHIFCLISVGILVDLRQLEPYEIATRRSRAEINGIAASCSFDVLACWCVGGSVSRCARPRISRLPQQATVRTSRTRACRQSRPTPPKFRATSRRCAPRVSVFPLLLSTPDDVSNQHLAARFVMFVGINTPRLPPKA